jgi:manganese transport protein
LATGLVPHITFSNHKDGLLYGYFAVGIFSAMLMEYEVHFYSSGAIEEDWTPKDLKENFMVASFGSILGSLLTIALMVVAALVLLPRGIFPELFATTVLAGAFPFGKALIIALLGSLACVAGAAVETNLSRAYNFCQFSIYPGAKIGRSRKKFPHIPPPGWVCLRWHVSSLLPVWRP